MDSFTLYRTWFGPLAQLSPDGCRSRVRNMTWLIVGLYRAMSVHLSAIVRKWPLGAKNPSLWRRLERFLSNPAVREWYEPVARQWLDEAAATLGEIRLIVDGTKVGFGHQLLIVCLAFRRRAVPIAWTWVPYSRGHSSGWVQLALLASVHGLLPKGVAVVLLGDSEFGSVAVIRQLRRWRWGYVLRQKGNHLVRLKGQRVWQPFASLVSRAGQSVWCAEAFLTQQWRYPTALLAHWAQGEKEPWLLATNLPDAHTTRQAYQRRMWIDEMFGDLKRHGCDLETTHLRHFMRLSRLTWAVCLPYSWLLQVGRVVIRRGLRHRVDRHDRRDLSLFRIGRDSIEKRLALNQPIPFAPAFIVSSG
ncbi:MAG: IS4 family transposase [Chloroflexi bacterium]|nr:IS4 family transposase [Chloroflexota bacterium]